MNAPVLIFVYNRPEHTERLLQSLNACYGADEHDLYIFSDAPKNNAAETKVQMVRKLIKEYSLESSFHKIEIIQSNVNKGLANSIIDGVSKIINQYGTAIVLEDDLIVSNDFLLYMQDALKYYADEQHVGAISGYSVNIGKKRKKIGSNVYKSRTGNSWGWATWVDRWKLADWKVKDYEKFCIDRKARKNFERQQCGIVEMLDRQMRGEIDSWAVRWDYMFFRKGLWTIYPPQTKVANNGFDGSGVHCDKNSRELVQKVDCTKYQMVELDYCVDMTKVTSGNKWMEVIYRRLNVFKLIHDKR